MKFVFSDSLSLKWNGNVARNKNGISGTHNAIMYLAEALALNHEVICVSIFNNIIPDKYNGVTYINYNEFETCNCDYIITTYFVSDFLILDKINNYNKIIMIMNNPIDLHTNLIKKDIFYNIDPNKVIIAFISNASKELILSYKESKFLKYYNHILLNNSIDINDIKPIVTKENSFIFFACIGRGFKLVRNILDKFSNFKVYTNTYDDNYKNELLSNNIHVTEDASKNTIFNYCAKSKYFIYPLINLDDNYVHCDTFGYVILEALLHGVVVIAPKTKLYEELYGDAICYIDVDDVMPELYFELKNEKLGYPIINRYIEKLNLLENNVELYDSYVKKGLLLKERYSNKIIVNTLLDNLEKVNLDLSKINKIKLIRDNIMSKTILTIFAGRESNLNILNKYLSKAIDLKLIDEVHYWNYTRKKEDEIYIKSISNLKRTSNNQNNTFVKKIRYVNNKPVIYLSPQVNNIEGLISSINDYKIDLSDDFIEINTPIINNSFNFLINCLTNLIIIIKDSNVSYQIIINSNGTNKNLINVSIINDEIVVTIDEKDYLRKNIISNFNINNIYLKTVGVSSDILYTQTKNKNFYLMDTCQKKPWTNYYNYYDKTEYKNDIIIKCDDDILYIDLSKLEEFIDYAKTTDNHIVFANTINNGVSAYYQQNKYNLIPSDLMRLEYPMNGLCGSLWESGTKAEQLHNYFIDNYKSFIDYNYNNEIIPITTRFSINFFAIKGIDWYKIKDCGNDDEQNITVKYVKECGLKNVLYTNLYVAHLSFYKQEETKINSNDLRVKYAKLANLVLN